MSVLQIEFPFALPCGYVDTAGTLHREGLMRRATARDELEALAHPRARLEEPYAAVVLLSRVVVRLGSIGPLSPAMVEELFATDFSYLQDLYLQLNGSAPRQVQTACPTCGTRLSLNIPEADEADS